MKKIIIILLLILLSLLIFYIFPVKTYHIDNGGWTIINSCQCAGLEFPYIKFRENEKSCYGLALKCKGATVYVKYQLIRSLLPFLPLILYLFILLLGLIKKSDSFNIIKYKYKKYLLIFLIFILGIFILYNLAIRSYIYKDKPNLQQCINSCLCPCECICSLECKTLLKQQNITKCDLNN